MGRPRRRLRFGLTLERAILERRQSLFDQPGMSPRQEIPSEVNLDECHVHARALRVAHGFPATIEDGATVSKLAGALVRHAGSSRGERDRTCVHESARARQ